jgi:uncharacterized membrane protein
MKEEIKKSKVHNYIFYFIIFSILGIIAELIFSKLNIERNNYTQGTILGPLCFLYGLGAVILISILNKYKDKKIKLFIYGAAIATVIQYAFSFILEAVFGVKFWNYSWTKLNINNRICLQYSFVWGIWSVIFIGILNKYIDKIIDKIKGKIRIILDIIISIILLAYILFTVWGTYVYTSRKKDELNGKNYVSNNNTIEQFQNEVFSNERMKKIDPNLYINVNGEDIKI